MEFTIDWLYGFYTGVAVAGLAYASYRTFVIRERNTKLLEWWVRKERDRLILKLLERDGEGRGEMLTIDINSRTGAKIGEALLKGAEIIAESGTDGSKDDNG